MSGEGCSIDSKGPPPPRKLHFDTQTSSDEENSEDEMPELGDFDTEFDDDEQRKAADPVASTEDDVQSNDAHSSVGKKPKAPNQKRVFILQKTWDLEEHDATDVDAAIRVELGDLNSQAGLSKVKTLQHQDMNNMYCDWIFSRHWISGSGAIVL